MPTLTQTFVWEKSNRSRTCLESFWAGPRQSNLQHMKHTHTYNLTVAAVANHYALSPRTVRGHLQTGSLYGVRLKGEWRCSWPDVWAAERGPMPKGARTARYKERLLKKKDFAAKWATCEKTVERWIKDGLPTRNVFGSVRIAPVEAETWIRHTFGLTSPGS